MTRPKDALLDITPDIVLKAYACGIFPMAESADDPTLYWIEPKVRGILPLDRLRISRRLARTMRRGGYEIAVDGDFEAVISACAEPGPGRRKTWINAEIRRLYRELFDLGHVHTVEVYREERLVGGLYGVSIGAAFFGESMFHRESDTSKIALVHLVARLRHGGYTLLDTQFTTPHLESMGAIEVPRTAYQSLLEESISGSASFSRLPSSTSAEESLQLVSHTS